MPQLFCVFSTLYSNWMFNFARTVVVNSYCFLSIYSDEYFTQFQCYIMIRIQNNLCSASDVRLMLSCMNCIMSLSGAPPAQA